MARRAREAAALAFVAVAAACPDPPEPSASEGRAIDPDAIRVRADSIAIQTGEIGLGQEREEATYALVDAKNEGEEPARVTLGGALTSSGGERVAKLREETLRVPPGAQRTFALVADDDRARPRADAANARLERARAAVAEPPLAVTDGNVYRDRDHEGNERAVVKASVENRGDGRARALVMAAFHDGEGRPLERPFTAVEIDGGEDRSFRFVGPPGSARGMIYVGPSRF